MLALPASAHADVMSRFGRFYAMFPVASREACPDGRTLAPIIKTIPRPAHPPGTLQSRRRGRPAIIESCVASKGCPRWRPFRGGVDRGAKKRAPEETIDGLLRRSDRRIHAMSQLGVTTFVTTWCDTGV